jgi:GT2 family glycosyltransferase
MNDISVIILNYNSSNYTIDCVASIIKNTSDKIKYEIIIVDNNSKEHDYQNLISNINQIENIKIIRSKINLGFAGGNHFGVQFSNSKYIYFLNNDCVLLNDNLSILFDFMEKNQNVGIAAGQMYNEDMGQHCSFGYFPSLSSKIFGTGLLRLFNPTEYPSKKIEYKLPIKVPYVTGAAMFVDFSKFAEVGGFDTNFFLYCEEEEIALKMRKAGFEIYLVPDVKFIHFSGKSSERSYEFEREFFISFLYFLRKHYSCFNYQFIKLYFVLKNLKKFYKGMKYLKLAFFILSGANIKYSLRNKQKFSR